MFIGISADSSSYVSIFITHFLNTPKKDSKILRKLYVDLKLSTRDIEKLTQYSCSKSSILRALRKHKIIKNIYTQLLKISINTKELHLRFEVTDSFKM